MKWEQRRHRCAAQKSAWVSAWSPNGIQHDLHFLHLKVSQPQKQGASQDPQIFLTPESSFKETSQHADSSSAWSLRFPRGSNGKSSIISRSPVTRSPYLHVLNAATSRAEAKAHSNLGRTAAAGESCPENRLQIQI